MPTPARGDVYHIDIAKSEVLGREIYGPHWWVVLSIVQLSNTVGVFTAAPLTSVLNKADSLPKDREGFRHFRIRILREDKIRDPNRTDSIFDSESIVLPEQIRTFSIERIQNSSRRGTVSNKALAAIEAGLLFLLGSPLHQGKLELTQTPGQLQPSTRLKMSDDPKLSIPGRPGGLSKTS